jgi:16S rRNA (guanine527-N7)-methyltransferase
MNIMECELSKGLDQLHIVASQAQQDHLLFLLQQLIKWNKTYNLTAIKDPREVLTRHLMDSLAVIPYINHKTILDVGTGAGFPGLPLAIMLPKTQFTLLDSNSKKIRFIRQQIHELKLSNVEVIHSRVEDAKGTGYQAIISRAFASMEDMVNLTKHLLASGGVWLAMKGKYSGLESATLKALVNEVNVHELKVPGLGAKRCLVLLELINQN